MTKDEALKLALDDWTPCMKLPVVVYVRKQRFEMRGKMQ